MYTQTRLVLFFVTVAASTARLIAGPGEAGMDFKASWAQLPAADSSILLSAPNPALAMQLMNNERHEVTVRLEGYLEFDGLTSPIKPLTIPVAGGESKNVTLALPMSQINLNSIQYSGRIVVQAMATSHQTREETPQTTAPVYFSPYQGRIALYRDRAMRESFGAGNFRGFPMDTRSAMAAAERALREAGLANVNPAPARVVHAQTFAGPASGTNGMRFCLAMPGDAYVDSSRGEDFGTMALTVPVRRGWVVLSQNGSGLYTGFLDELGCTPSLPAAPNTPTLMVFSPLHLNGAKNIRGFVSDLNLGAAWPANMPLYFLNFNSGNTATATVLADKTEYAQTIFAAAAQGMERFHGGLSNVTYEWQIRQQGDNTGTATVYAPAGHPRVDLKYSLAALQKFTIVHEYGHAVLMAKVNPPLTPGDIDYSVEAGEPNQHAMLSKEWQLTAAVEGFAHFVAAVAWNDVYPNADGSIYFDNQYDIATYGRYFESNWIPPSYPDQGVELDWAQFFWSYYTDTPAVVAPSQATLLNIWLASHPWPKHAGFYAGFAGAANALLPATVPPAIPAGLPMQWFTIIASQAGIIH